VRKNIDAKSMRVWREGSNAKALAVAAASASASAAAAEVKADKALRRKVATQQLKDEILNIDKDETRNDAPVPAVDTGLTKKQKKKRSNRISIGRNTSFSNDKNGTRESAPEEAPNNTSSTTLSRLLFSKQNMEQRQNIKVVYRQFGPDAEDVLRVEKDDGMPSPEGPDHVIIKVQVCS
jgi:hypothetical protein